MKAGVLANLAKEFKKENLARLAREKKERDEKVAARRAEVARLRAMNDAHSSMDDDEDDDEGAPAAHDDDEDEDDAV